MEGFDFKATLPAMAYQLRLNYILLSAGLIYMYWGRFRVITRAMWRTTPDPSIEIPPL
jgi:hypothetical protein